MRRKHNCCRKTARCISERRTEGLEGEGEGEGARVFGEGREGVMGEEWARGRGGSGVETGVRAVSTFAMRPAKKTRSHLCM